MTITNNNIPENEFRFIVKSFETNLRQTISVPALASLMQEAAMRNADNFRASIETLQNQGVSWVLNRFRLTMNTYPAYNTTIMIKTYPVRMDKFFVIRDYLIFNDLGEEIGCATSNWFVLDMEKRTMTTIPDTIRQIQLPPIESPQPPLMGKLRPPVEINLTKSFKAYWHDLDFNLHVSNISYIRWVAENVPEGYLDSHELSELDINFKGECSNNDMIIAEAQQIDNQSFIHRLSREADGKELVVAKTTWRQL